MNLVIVKHYALLCYRTTYPLGGPLFLALQENQIIQVYVSLYHKIHQKKHPTCL